MNTRGFGTRRCGLCEAGISELDAWCSDQCEVEADRRAELHGQRMEWLAQLGWEQDQRDDYDRKQAA